MNCIVCHTPLPDRQGQPGRPRTYCTPACRRVAEHEIRRLDHRLEHLEAERDRLLSLIDSYAVMRPTGTAVPALTAAELASVERAIDSATARMRDLLAEGEHSHD